MTIPSTLQDPLVAAALERMFAAAEHDDAAERESLARRQADSGPVTVQEWADAAAEIYMPISAAGGGLLYSLIRAARPRTVVEFGTSFGISTLYLAAAVRDNGFGRVVTTELSSSKVAAARRTFEETGLDDIITVLEGDALETLPAYLGELDGAEGTGEGSVGLLLLDGWKNLYLPILHLLEPRMAPGALVVADDTDMESVQPYLAHIREPEHGYQSTSFPVEDGMEISCRL